MGPPLPTHDSAEDLLSEHDSDGRPKDASVRIAHVLEVINALPPRDLSTLLTTMLATQTLPAKEAIAELIWQSLTPREKVLFEMPSISSARHPWSQEEILRALSARPINFRSVPQIGTSSTSGDYPSPSSNGVSPNSLPSPRFRFSSQIGIRNPYHSRDRNDDDDNDELPSSFRMRVPGTFRNNARGLGRSANAEGSGGGVVRDVEDQIYDVLIQAIERAERAAAISNAMESVLRNVQTSNRDEGTSTGEGGSSS
ncbi:hypothetical protein HDU96_000807 [Phlyctochytrium bullatum]|nr:hypothetical protein HDU96_000807 [Phlyctochytrium bullatum]